MSTTTVMWSTEVQPGETTTLVGMSEGTAQELLDMMDTLLRGLPLVFYTSGGPASGSGDIIGGIVTMSAPDGTVMNGLAALGQSLTELRLVCGNLTNIRVTPLRSLANLYVDGSAESLPEAFAVNGVMSHVMVTAPLTSIGASAFQSSALASISLPDSLTSIGASAFQSCTALTGITLPDSLTSIGARAFQSCTALTGITLPDSLTSISDYTFNQCGLTSIRIPNSVTSIGVSAFEMCQALTSVELGDAVETIGSSAFVGGAYASIDIPSSVVSIGSNAFITWADSLVVTCRATTPPTMNGNAFRTDGSVSSIKVPAGSVDAYKSASGWSAFAAVITAIS